MKRKIVSGLIPTLLLISMLSLAFDIQPVKASGTIYIRADGSVDPDTAPISSVDNVTYTFTDNIYDEIVVERDNIVVDGAGYTLQGTGAVGSKGIDLTRRNNITIQDMKIDLFYVGIFFSESSNNSISANTIKRNAEALTLARSSSNSVSGNKIYFNYYGIYLSDSFNNSISGNKIIGVAYYSGIYLFKSFNNSISGNTIAYSPDGILLYYFSNYNNISGNYITDNGCGIGLSSSNNRISGNNITDNRYGIRLSSSNNSISGNTITNSKMGIILSSSNNRISGNNITDNGYGIYLYGCSNNGIFGNNITANEDYGVLHYASSNNGIYGNDITANEGYGIYFFGSSNYNGIFGNNITANYRSGIHLSPSSNYNGISGNYIANNGYGIDLWKSSNNGIFGNNITANNGYGICLSQSSNNSIYHNNFVDNTEQVRSEYCPPNFWDDGYPSGGNYWSDYSGVDLYGGPNQDLPGSDGIWDHAYIIDANNRDNYPFVNPWVDSIPPVADAGPDQTVYEDTPVTFDGRASSDNVGITRYIWTFVDVTPQTLTGTTPTYTFTDPGIYIVTLNVSDAAGNYATDTVTITVLSLTPEYLTQKLIEAIETWNLREGTENSLTSKLEEAILLLNKGNENGAVHKLMDFINQVEALRDKQLTNEQADYLIAVTQRIIDLIEE